MHSPQQLILRPDVDGKHLGKHLLVLLSLAITCKTNKKNWTWCNYLQIAAVVVSKVIYRNRLYLCQIQEKGKASLVWTKIFLCIQFFMQSIISSISWPLFSLLSKRMQRTISQAILALWSSALRNLKIPWTSKSSCDFSITNKVNVASSRHHMRTICSSHMKYTTI